MALKDLDTGVKVDLHVGLYRSEVKTLDALRKKYSCSRGAILGALLREHAGTEIKVETFPTDTKGRDPRVAEDAPRRRPGGGRKKGPPKDPMEEFYAIVPELRRKI